VRDRHGIGDHAGQRQVIALLGAVAIHRGDEQFACAEFSQTQRMLQRVDAGRLAAAMGEDLPAVRLAGL